MGTRKLFIRKSKKREDVGIGGNVEAMQLAFIRTIIM